MRRISVKWILKCLKADQKHTRVEVLCFICAWFYKDADFLNHVVTIDETWVHY